MRAGRVLGLILGAPGTAFAAPWHLTPEVDALAFVLAGATLDVTVRPGPAPRWRFGLLVGRKAMPRFASGIDPANRGWSFTLPILAEATVDRAFAEDGEGLAVGARAGYVHLHYAHPDVFGLAEDSWLALTPTATWRFRIVRGLVVRPALGVRVPVHVIRDLGEIEVSEAESTYHTWPLAIDLAGFVGYEF